MWHLSCTPTDANRVCHPREVIDMAYRTFVDKDGSYWQVWDSQPTRVERRVSPADRPRQSFYPWRGPERRTGADWGAKRIRSGCADEVRFLIVTAHTLTDQRERSGLRGAVLRHRDLSRACSVEGDDFAA